jgi:hypothetical protein
MQNAYASHQFVQLIGRFSWPLAEFVHVAKAGEGDEQVRLAFVGARLLSSDATQPNS